tara:strand:- start:10862 stop:12010 length:1149 start_codon:yes stop_codon:yes gene_type:complete
MYETPIQYAATRIKDVLRDRHQKSILTDFIDKSEASYLEKDREDISEALCCFKQLDQVARNSLNPTMDGIGTFSWLAAQADRQITDEQIVDSFNILLSTREQDYFDQNLQIFTLYVVGDKELAKLVYSTDEGGQSKLTMLAGSLAELNASLANVYVDAERAEYASIRKFIPKSIEFVNTIMDLKGRRVPAIFNEFKDLSRLIVEMLEQTEKNFSIANPEVKDNVLVVVTTAFNALINQRQLQAWIEASKKIKNFQKQWPADSLKIPIQEYKKNAYQLINVHNNSTQPREASEAVWKARYESTLKQVEQLEGELEISQGMLSQLSDQLKECAQAMQSQYDNNIVIENENKNLREEINRLSKGRSQQEENNDPNALHHSSKFFK